MQIFFLLLTITLTIILDFMIISVWRRYNQTKTQYIFAKRPFTKLGLIKIAFSETINKWFFDNLTKEYQNNQLSKKHLKTILELALLAFVAIIITLPYQNFNKDVIPAGSEFSSVTQNHHLWTRALECGWCAIWNGSIGGGYPAFVDLHGSALHPIIIITTLLWGVVNGTKVALFISFWLAGIAQWWLAKELKVSTLARLWTACIAITGGHLTSRMELGTFGLVFSTAMSSFVFAALINIIRRGDRKSVALFAIVLASAILSGQGYLQVGLVLMSPAILFLIWEVKFNNQLWKNFVQAISIAILLASPFLVPFLNFSSQFTKWQDPEFYTAQPLKYLPLNLLIDNHEYYLSETLEKTTYPYMNAHFIGWVPVTLAVLGLTSINRENRRYILFMSSGVILIFLAASATSLKWIAYIYPGITGVRHSAIISGLAIPLIIGLSAYGLDKLINIKWPKFWISIEKETLDKALYFPIKWILIIPFLLLALKQTYEFSTYWMYTVRIEANIHEMIAALHTPTLEWVNTPFGEHEYLEPAIRANLKLSPGILAWGWDNREIPTPRLEALRGEAPPDNPVELKIVDEIFIYFREWEHYASVLSNDEIIPCKANGTGGRITVRCNIPYDGILTVKENMWIGWTAWQDSRPIEMLNNPFLQVKASAGEHIYQFEYRPWDVPIGIVLSLAGIFLCAWLWWKPEILVTPSGQENQEQQTH